MESLHWLHGTLSRQLWIAFEPKFPSIFPYIVDKVKNLLPTAPDKIFHQLVPIVIWFFLSPALPEYTYSLRGLFKISHTYSQHSAMTNTKPSSGCATNSWFVSKPPAPQETKRSDHNSGQIGGEDVTEPGCKSCDESLKKLYFYM